VTRQEGLLAANAVAEATVQQARASVISANASLESVRTQLVQQQQSLDTARGNLEAATVRAPIAGTIVDLPSQVGQSVAAGTALMTIADLATMTVTAQVSEADIGRLDAGMSAYFTTLAGSTRRWTGTLREILPTPTIENSARSCPRRRSRTTSSCIRSCSTSTIPTAR
jgi:macrolide-specific efflux system membrane fusion protein